MTPSQFWTPRITRALSIRVDRSSSPVFNVRPPDCTQQWFVLTYFSLASLLHAFIIIYRHLLCLKSISAWVCLYRSKVWSVLSTARSKSLFHYGKHAREPQIIEYTFPTQHESTCVNIHRNRTHNISAGQSRNPRRWSWQKAIYLIKKKVKALLLLLLLLPWHNLWALGHVLPAGLRDT